MVHGRGSQQDPTDRVLLTAWLQAEAAGAAPGEERSPRGTEGTGGGAGRWGEGFRRRASVGSTEASASFPGRVGVVGRPKPARHRRYRRYGSTPSIRSALTGPSVSPHSRPPRRDAWSRQVGVT